MTVRVDCWEVEREIAAWDAIGFDGTLRIKGGRAIYEAVMYNCAARSSANSDTVTLARLGEYQGTRHHGLHQTNRRVGPDTVLEILRPVRAERDGAA